MPQMQPTTPGTAMPAAFEPTPAFEDCDYALGCECADPSLQIERWGQEIGGAALEAN